MVEVEARERGGRRGGVQQGVPLSGLHDASDGVTSSQQRASCPAAQDCNGPSGGEDTTAETTAYRAVQTVSPRASSHFGEDSVLGTAQPYCTDEDDGNRHSPECCPPRNDSAATINICGGGVQLASQDERHDGESAVATPTSRPASSLEAGIAATAGPIAEAGVDDEDVTDTRCMDGINTALQQEHSNCTTVQEGPNCVDEEHGNVASSGGEGPSHSGSIGSGGNSDDSRAVLAGSPTSLSVVETTPPPPPSSQPPSSEEAVPVEVTVGPPPDLVLRPTSRRLRLMSDRVELSSPAAAAAAEVGMSMLHRWNTAPAASSARLLGVGDPSVANDAGGSNFSLIDDEEGGRGGESMGPLHGGQHGGMAVASVVMEASVVPMRVATAQLITQPPQQQSPKVRGAKVQNWDAFRNRRVQAVVACLVVVIVAVGALAVTFSLRGNGNGGEQEGKDSSPAKESLARGASLRAFVYEVVSEVSGEDVLQDPNSSQSRALSWMNERYGLREASSGDNNDPDSIIQLYVVALLYFSMGGETWANQAQFLSGEHECLWKGSTVGGQFVGVECVEEDRVTHLSLWNNNAAGTIPTEIGMLSRLRTLAFRTNNLNGTIPTEIGMLTDLDFLALNGNNFGGTIPTELGSANKLTLLYLDHNSLYGTIPSSLGHLTMMKEMQLNHNFLNGTVPLSLANMESAETISMQGNSLTGSVEFLCEALDVSSLLVDEDVNCSCCQ